MQIQARHEEGVDVLDLTGRFDAYEAPPVADWLEDAATKPPARVVVNLEGVVFIDSTGLSTLVQGMKHARQQGGDVVLCGMQQAVRIIFELTRLDRAFRIENAETDAREAFEDAD